jgi:autotransporter-associated beta strand protein
VTSNGFEVSAGGSLNVGGNLTVGQFGRLLVNPTAGGAGRATINGNIELTGGNTFVNNASNAGGGIIKLNSGAVEANLLMKGDLTTQPSTFSAAIDGTNDTDNFVELNGNRSFNIADGGAGDDFIMNAIFRNDGANVGGIIKNGAGTMILNNTAAVANTYTGPTVVNAGNLDLARPAGTTAITGTSLVVGNGTDSAAVRLRNSNQIADTVAVTLNAGSSLDFDSMGNHSETVASITAASATTSVKLGVGSVLTLNGGTASTVAGPITGAGSVALANAGTSLTLSGVSDLKGLIVADATTLTINGSVTGALVDVTGTLKGTGSVSVDRNGTEPAIRINAGGVFAPGNSPGIITTGTVAMGPSSTLSIEIAGLTPGTGHDQISTSGMFSIDSTAMITLTTTATGLVVGDYVDVVINDGSDAIGGAFSNLAEGGMIPVGGAYSPASPG